MVVPPSLSLSGGRTSIHLYATAARHARPGAGRAPARTRRGGPPPATRARGAGRAAVEGRERGRRRAARAGPPATPRPALGGGPARGRSRRGSHGGPPRATPRASLAARRSIGPARAELRRREPPAPPDARASRAGRRGPPGGRRPLRRGPRLGQSSIAFSESEFVCPLSRVEGRGGCSRSSERGSGVADEIALRASLERRPSPRGSGERRRWPPRDARGDGESAGSGGGGVGKTKARRRPSSGRFPRSTRRAARRRRQARRRVGSRNSMARPLPPISRVPFSTRRSSHPLVRGGGGAGAGQRVSRLRPANPWVLRGGTIRGCGGWRSRGPREAREVDATLDGSFHSRLVPAGELDEVLEPILHGLRGKSVRVFREDEV